MCSRGCLFTLTLYGIPGVTGAQRRPEGQTVVMRADCSFEVVVFVIALFCKHVKVRQARRTDSGYAGRLFL